RRGSPAPGRRAAGGPRRPAPRAAAPRPVGRPGGAAPPHAAPPSGAPPSATPSAAWSFRERVRWVGRPGRGRAARAVRESRGARVAVLDRRFEEAAVLAKQVGGEAYDVDLGDVRETAEAMDRALDGLRGIDVLVNTAGVLRYASLLELRPEDWDEVFAVNTRA